MGDIVNLRQARKQRARAAAADTAAANRARFGRSRQDKADAARDAERAARRLDGAKLDD